MALGRAFIEVHADLKPFKKSLGDQVARIVKDTQKIINESVEEASGKASRGRGKIDGRGMTIKPKLDTTDADREARGFFGRFRQYGQKAFSGVIDGFAYAIKNSDSVETAAIVVAGIVGTIASPLIAAAIAGAITAGVGTAGIAAGVALAFQDQRIQASAAAMWDRIMGQLDRIGGQFLQPVQSALEILEVGFNNFAPRLERIFASIAPYVDDLAIGLVRSLEAIGPGLETAFANAGPMLQIVAEYMPIVAEAMGYFFAEISSSAGARAGLVVFFQMVGDAIVYAANVITTLSDAFGYFLLIIDRIPDALMPDGLAADIDEAIAAMVRADPSTQQFAGGLQRVKNEGQGASGAANNLTASLNTFFGAALNSMDASIRFEDALDDVRDTLKDNGKNFDINTAKGRENVGMVNNAVKAAIAARDAKLKETGSVSQANSVYSTQIERLRGVLKNAGLTKGEIDKLIGAYDDIPPEVSTTVSVPGLATALTQAQALDRELQSINSQRGALRRAGSGDGVGGYAEGGVVRREQLAWVGEQNKPEAIVPLTNPRRAAEVMEEAGLNGFGGTIVVQMVLDGKVIDERVVQVNQDQARQIRQQPRRVL